MIAKWVALSRALKDVRNATAGDSNDDELTAFNVALGIALDLLGVGEDEW